MTLTFFPRLLAKTTLTGLGYGYCLLSFEKTDKKEEAGSIGRCACTRTILAAGSFVSSSHIFLLPKMYGCRCAADLTHRGSKKSSLKMTKTNYNQPRRDQLRHGRRSLFGREPFFESCYSSNFALLWFMKKGRVSPDTTQKQTTTGSFQQGSISSLPLSLPKNDQKVKYFCQFGSKSLYFSSPGPVSPIIVVVSPKISQLCSVLTRSLFYFHHKLR